MSSDTVVWNHPELGQIRGASPNPVITQFRNVPYATIPERWKHCEMATKLSQNAVSGQPYDATAWGPVPPQHDGAIDFDFALIQKDLHLDHDLDCDEFTCLNLVISKPAGNINGLPVLVFVHGGGFFVGCNAWPQYDLCALVELSVTLENPIIAVGINYRVGLLGLLASEEISDPRSAGNFALIDQETAFKWIKCYIKGFGGDPNNVTAVGQSAGAISLWLHLLRGEPIFERAMTMSGDPRLRSPKTLKENQAIYESLLKELGINASSQAERVAALQNVDWARLIASPLNARCFPTSNNGFQGFKESVEGLKGQLSECFSWCKTIVAGDCLHDATVLLGSLTKPDWFSKFKTSFSRFFTPNELERVIVAYNLRRPSPEDVHPGLLQLASDIKYYMPVFLAGEAAELNANIHLYHFHKPCPFDGVFKNLVGHVYDVAYFTQNYRYLLPPQDRIASERFGRYVIELANGYLDTPPENSLKRANQRVQIWDTGLSPRLCSAAEYDKEYRGNSGILLRELGVQKCYQALDMYQFGSS